MYPKLFPLITWEFSLYMSASFHSDKKAETWHSNPTKAMSFHY